MVLFVDAKTDELRAAHDVLAEFYADRLAGALDRMPAERAVLGLFCDLTRAAGLGTGVGDVGCGTGRLAPYLAARGLGPRGIDLSPEMIRVARRDHPGFDFDIADLRQLPFGDASLAGLVCWYSLMYLAPSDRPAAFGELARVLKPGGYLVTAFKAGDSRVRRGGRSTGLGVEFDVYWLSPGEMERRVTDAGFAAVFWGGRPAEGREDSPQGYLLAQRSSGRPIRAGASTRQDRRLTTHAPGRQRGLLANHGRPADGSACRRCMRTAARRPNTTLPLPLRRSADLGRPAGRQRGRVCPAGHIGCQDREQPRHVPAA
jgi:SAM-dependent methyltransferase